MPAMFGSATNNATLFGLDAASHAVERITGPASSLWLLVFVVPMFLFTPDHGAAAALVALEARARGRPFAAGHAAPAAPSPQRAHLS